MTRKLALGWGQIDHIVGSKMLLISASLNKNKVVVGERNDVEQCYPIGPQSYSLSRVFRAIKV